MSYALTMNNFTAPPPLCNQTLLEMAKDKKWHQKMHAIQSALQSLQHFQGEVWYKQGCQDQCGSRHRSCRELVIPPELREALQTYGHFYLFEKKNEDESPVLVLPQFDCWTSRKLLSNSWIADHFDKKKDFGKVNTPVEVKKRANIELWIKTAITDMEPTIKNYEKDLDALKSMDDSCLPHPPGKRIHSHLKSPAHNRMSEAIASPWQVWKIIGVLFLTGGPVLALVIGSYCFATRWLNRQIDVKDSMELDPL